VVWRQRDAYWFGHGSPELFTTEGETAMGHPPLRLLIALLGSPMVAVGCGGSSTPSTCFNGVADPGEGDVDCGGPCQLCIAGQGCEVAFDCESSNCADGICATSAASCSDRRFNGAETAVDCGGPMCVPCGAGEGCRGPTDCLSGDCQGGQCVAPTTCRDAELSPGETDVDCGGPCPGCAVTKTCREHTDCLSEACVFGLCAVPACDDGIANQDESDLDCGGRCDGCGLGGACMAADDCASGACEGATCCAPNACGRCGPPELEICDGIDNDCDGVIDGADELEAAPACDLQLGLCATVAARCDGAQGWVCDYLADDGRYEASETLCDGVDNDCDGVVDAGSEVPATFLCTKQAGVCQGAAIPCADGMPGQCDTADYQSHDPGYQAVETQCDGLDNDCDGQVDEGLLNACGSCGSLPVEACDLVDNDCDGQTDEGLRNACGDCGPAAVELCDRVDNNCNGQTDEGLRNACGDCGPAPLERCDKVDNDCDGQTDEGIDCSACVAPGVAIRAPALLRHPEDDNGVPDLNVFRLADGRVCGTASQRTTGWDFDDDFRMVSFCVEDGVPVVTNTVQATDDPRRLMKVVPLGDDFVIATAITSGFDRPSAWQFERTAPEGATQSITSSFPNLDDHEHVIASSGGALFDLSYPNDNADWTLTTYTDTGGVTTNLLFYAGSGASNPHMAASPGAVSPTIFHPEYGDGFGADWFVWHAGAIVATTEYGLSSQAALTAAGTMHFLGRSRERYHRYHNGVWDTFYLAPFQAETKELSAVVAKPNGDAWVIGRGDDAQGGRKLLLLDPLSPDADPVVARRRVSNAYFRTAIGVVVDDDERVQAFVGGRPQDAPHPDGADIYGYQTTLCPGYSDH
jgi:hypothetical protein